MSGGARNEEKEGMKKSQGGFLHQGPGFEKKSRKGIKDVGSEIL